MVLYKSPFTASKKGGVCEFPVNMEAAQVCVLLLLLVSTANASWNNKLSLGQIVSYGLPASGSRATPAGSYGTSQTGDYYPEAYGTSQEDTSYKQSVYPRDVVKQGYASSQDGYGQSAYPASQNQIYNQGYGQSAYPTSQNQVYNQGYGQSAYPSSQEGYFGTSGGQGVVGGARGGDVFGSYPGYPGRKASPALARLISRVVSYGIPVYSKHRYH